MEGSRMHHSSRCNVLNYKHKLKANFTFNIEFSEWLFEKAAKYEIPVKYASSASVYGNEQGIINPLNYYALSKVTTDYWVQDNMDRFPINSRIPLF